MTTQLPMQSSSSSTMATEAGSTAARPVVIRCGHIIPSIRLTPPDSRPAMAPRVPEQDLGCNSLYVPLRTEEVGWEEGGLIWAPKRYCYPTVNLYGGSDDHVIGTYRGGPKGYRFINITDKAFALASQDDEDLSETKTKTGKDFSKSSLPKGPATKIQERTVTKVTSGMPLPSSSAASSSSSSPCSSRRGSSSTADGDASSGADTGMTTPTSDITWEENGEKQQEELVHKLDAALHAIQGEDESGEDGSEGKKTRLASRAGAVEISNEPVDALQTQLQSKNLGLDRSLTLSDSIPESHFQDPRGRSFSRPSFDADYTAGWSYEQNMKCQFQKT